MPFPESDRIIYKKNPLENVICQLRFPPILKIDKEIPSEFQEKIRKEFPNYEQSIEPNIPVPSEIRSSLPANIQMAFASTENRNYKFSSEDDLWSINLTHTFLALSTKKYETWEDFWKKLQDPLNALIDIYRPSSFSRIGLRYIDVIKRRKLGLEKFNWNELLESHVLGLLSSKVGDQVQSLQSTYFVHLGNDSGIAKIMAGYEKATEDNEDIFKIDTDFFLSQKTDINKTKKILDRFHTLGGRLIRWIIKDKLHEAMNPQKP